MTNMPDEIVFGRIMIAGDFEFERALHYHNEGYDSDNDYDLSSPFMRPVHIYLVLMTEASLNPMDYRWAQSHTFPSTARQPRDGLPLYQVVGQQFTFCETPTSVMDSDDDEEEDFPTVELNDQVWSEEPIPDRQCQSITGHTPRPTNPPHNPFKKRYSQKQNQWMSQYQMTYQTSFMFLRKSFTHVLTLGHRVYSDIYSEMPFDFSQ